MVHKLFKPRPIYVRCNQCGETHDEDRVSFVNLVRAETGDEILTFKCPNEDCKGVSKGVRQK